MLKCYRLELRGCLRGDIESPTHADSTWTDYARHITRIRVLIGPQRY